MKKFGMLFLVLIFAILISCDILDIIDRFVSENYLDRTELLEDGRMHVVLVGTGGPIANERRISQSTAILAGGEFILVDTGPGSARRSSLLKLPGAHLSGILLTHYHSDHIGDLGETNIQSWIDGRTGSLEVFGPEGVDDVVDGFNKAYALDVMYRNTHHGEEYMPREAGIMHSKTITFSDPNRAELVLDRNGLKAYAFNVNHDPAKPAVGYRFEYRGNIVVITGDTKKTANLAEYAQHADILMSEVLSFDLVDMVADSLTRLGLERPAKLMRDVLEYHMDPVQVGEVARDAGAGKLVLTHVFPPAPDFLDRLFTDGAKKAYSGQVIMGEDGMFFALDPKN
jgi:ribonuclease Z